MEQPGTITLVNERDERFYVDRSGIPDAGDGLFARVPLEAGATLDVVGIRVAPLSIADRCTHYADAYKYRIDGALLIPIGFAAMVNHADVPNVEQVADAGRLYLRTLRPIAVGEELLLTYGENARERLAQSLATRTTTLPKLRP